jgi:hypothetical protein
MHVARIGPFAASRPLFRHFLSWLPWNSACAPCMRIFPRMIAPKPSSCCSIWCTGGKGDSMNAWGHPVGHPSPIRFRLGGGGLCLPPAHHENTPIDWRWLRRVVGRPRAARRRYEGAPGHGPDIGRNGAGTGPATNPAGPGCGICYSRKAPIADKGSRSGDASLLTWGASKFAGGTQANSFAGRAFRAES